MVAFKYFPSLSPCVTVQYLSIFINVGSAIDNKVMHVCLVKTIYVILCRYIRVMVSDSRLLLYNFLFRMWQFLTMLLDVYCFRRSVFLDMLLIQQRPEVTPTRKWTNLLSTPVIKTRRIPPCVRSEFKNDMWIIAQKRSKLCQRLTSYWSYWN